MKFEHLTEIHTDRLLDFELQNRAWFESLIAPRDDEFYSRQGVVDHISELKDSQSRHEALSFVALVDDEIIGRANLKNICSKTKTAEVGYRVAAKHVGVGVATLCLAELVRVSMLNPAIVTLRAKVLDNNPASKRVLVKQGFEKTGYERDYFTINGSAFGCTTFERLVNVVESTV